MSRFVLDTNLYIDAARSKQPTEELKSFVSAFLPSIYFHAVVAQELLVGATSVRARGVAKLGTSRFLKLWPKAFP